MFRRLTILALVGGFACAGWAQVRSEYGTSTTPPRLPSTLALLNKRIPEVNFDEVPLQEVLNWVADTTGANVVVRWQVLEDAGINPDDPITLKLKNMRLSQVLWMVMNEAGGVDLKLAYRASGNTLILSTEEDLGKEMIVKIYDLRDLLVGTARFEAPQMDPGQALSNFGSQGGGGGNTLFRNTTRTQQNRQNTNNAESPELSKLIEIIKNTIEPDSWADTGTGTGTIYSYNGMIVVYNTPLVHQQIGGFVEEEDWGE